MNVDETLEAEEGMHWREAFRGDGDLRGMIEGPPGPALRTRSWSRGWRVRFTSYTRKLETTLGELASEAADLGAVRIVVAGGETSGAVV